MKTYQESIALNTLYSCQATNLGDGDTLVPFIEVLGGTATVYGSVQEPHQPPSLMSAANSAGVTGIMPFTTVPNFLYVTQASGSITSIILSGIIATPHTTA